MEFVLHYNIMTLGDVGGFC